MLWKGEGKVGTSLLGHSHFLLKTFPPLVLCQYLFLRNSYPLWLGNEVSGYCAQHHMWRFAKDWTTTSHVWHWFKLPSERAKCVAWHQYPRPGSVTIVLIKHNVPIDGDMVINADYTRKRLWIQTPLSLHTTVNKLPDGSKSKVFRSGQWGLSKYVPDNVTVKVKRDDTCKERT